MALNVKRAFDEFHSRARLNSRNLTRGACQSECLMWDVGCGVPKHSVPRYHTAGHICQTPCIRKRFVILIMQKIVL